MYCRLYFALQPRYGYIYTNGRGTNGCSDRQLTFLNIMGCVQRMNYSIGLAYAIRSV